MKRKTGLTALLAITIALHSAAFAQGHGNGNKQGHGKRDEQGRHDQVQRADRDDRRDNQGRDFGDRHDLRRGDDRTHWNERGAGPNHAFHRGGRLPEQYRHRQYVVDDWRGHHLSAPPHGHHWVQTGGDYVLVAIGSGIILQLFLGG